MQHSILVFLEFSNMELSVRVKNVSCETESSSEDDITCSIKKCIKCSDFMMQI